MALEISHIRVHFVKLSDTQDPIQGSGHALPHQAFQPQSLTQALLAN